jgi:aminocarboxymuconate-semialdehyde decarboxylase
MPAIEIRPAPSAPTVGRRQSVTIDLHCHVLTLAVERLVAGCPEKATEAAAQLKMYGAQSTDHNRKMLASLAPQLTDVDRRLSDMDAMGVDIQVVSPSPNQYYYWADVDLANQIVITQNEHIASLCAEHPDRMSGLGSVALQHAELSVEQLTDCVRKLGLRGVEISSTVNGIELDDPRFSRFWAKAEELGCLIFLHPLGTSLGDRVCKHYLANIIGQPIETTIALSHLIFGGVLDRYPGLKICAAHGGGYLASYMGRSDHGHRVRPEAGKITRKPSQYLKQIYFDTVVYTPEALRHLVAEVGVTQVVVGTDYPFDMGAYDVHGLISAVPGLCDEEREMILGRNAARLLGLDRAASK